MYNMYHSYKSHTFVNMLLAFIIIISNDKNKYLKKPFRNESPRQRL